MIFGAYIGPWGRPGAHRHFSQNFDTVRKPRRPPHLKREEFRSTHACQMIRKKRTDIVQKYKEGSFDHAKSGICSFECSLWSKAINNEWRQKGDFGFRLKYSKKEGKCR